MPFIQTPELQIEYRTFGEGSPVTVFAHGVSSSIEDTRFLGSGVRGTRVFFHFRGHGESGVPEGGWDYAGATRDLRAVADEVEATQALGISMGAGAMLGLLAETPDRFERCAFVLPAGLDRPRSDGSLSTLLERADAIEHGTVESLTEYLIAELPDDLRTMRGIRELMRERAERQYRPGVARALRGLPSTPPLDDRTVLAKVSAPSLVIGQEGDEVHPSSVARELAAALPDARLHVFPRPWSMLRERDTLRDLVAGLLNGDSG